MDPQGYDQSRFPAEGGEKGIGTQAVASPVRHPCSGMTTLS